MIALRSLKAGILALFSLAPAAQAAAEARACPGPPGAGIAAARLGSGGANLLIDENFPDPFVTRIVRNWLALATGRQVGSEPINVQLRTSSDLTRWSPRSEALPASALPPWVDRSHPQVWAPELMRIGGRWVLYFNARHRTLTRTEQWPDGPHVLQRHCLGAAVSAHPQGPFRGTAEPLVCREFAEGVIDAHVFRDAGGELYLYYKHDANCCGGGSAIYGQRLAAGGLAVRGDPVKLIANDDSPGTEDDWEWRVVEAPTMVRRSSAYYLFYSGNFFGNRNYSVAYLKCAGPLGPCRDLGENPILWSHKFTPLIGPGHQSVLDWNGGSYVFFHGWNEDPDGKERLEAHKRCLYVSRLRWVRSSDGLRPVIDGGEPPEAP
jgi:GH43 family beta-xylosidase